MPDDVALLSLSHISGGLDLTKFPLDGPLPELPPSNAAKARQALVVKTARENNMTLRQIARHTAAGTGHRVLVGTPEYMADEMENVAEGRGGRRLQRRVQPLSQAVRGFLHARSCPSCSGAASSAPSTKARPCARIWAYAFRKTDTRARRALPWPRRRHEETLTIAAAAATRRARIGDDGLCARPHREGAQDQPLHLAAGGAAAEPTRRRS